MQKKTQESAEEDFSNSGKTGQGTILYKLFRILQGRLRLIVSWLDGVLADTPCERLGG